MSTQDILFLIGLYLFFAFIAFWIGYFIVTMIPESAKHRINKAVNDATMAIGIWLIGSRDTPREKQNDQHRRAAIVGRDAYQRERDDYKEKWHAAGKMVSDLLLEKNDAIKERDYWKSENEDTAILRDAWIEECTKLTRKHKALRKRYNTLRDRTISKTPKRKAKAKTKR